MGWTGRAEDSGGDGPRGPETGGVGWSSARARAVTGVAIAAALFHLSAAGFRPLTALVQRPIHLLLMVLLGLLGVGVVQRREPGARSRILAGVDVALAGAAAFSCLYLVLQNEALVARAGQATPLDLIAAGAALLVVVEIARRATGPGLVAVVVVALGYAFAGPWLPGALAHRGYGPTRVLEHLYLSTEGIWGIPLGVSADFVYLFILFGALLEVAGGGALLIAMADRVAGRSRGGPAKTAAVASALMGSLSGSAVANVVTTGSFTIPLMRRAGFKPFFAGAIEAAASTGGQLVPPVMGAGAFILATWTNIPYRTVAMAAVIPAVLYYTALIAAIHFRAGRMGLEGGAGSNGREEIGRRLHLLLPLAVIVVLLAMGRSPMRAAFWGVVSGALVAFGRRETRPDSEGVRRVLVHAGRGAVQVAAACAAAGVVVGVASLTGIGLRMSELILLLSQGNLGVALGLTALGSVVLGMGLPTPAAYVVLAALGAPALVELGVPLLSAHLFIFYFGCISNVTPPVSLAAFAAAGIAGAPAVRTALTAAVLATAGFAIPFLFVYEPALLLAGGWVQALLPASSALLGLVALAAAFMGFLAADLRPGRRILLAAAAVALLMPGLISDLGGLAAFVLLAITNRKNGGRVGESEIGETVV